MKKGHWICAVGLLVSLGLANGTLLAQQPTSVSDSFNALKNSVESESDWLDWKKYILPDEVDLKWQQIPWLATFSEGIEKAAEVDRPILLWTMNGHPLGCT